jgi:hypothetical protein
VVRPARYFFVRRIRERLSGTVREVHIPAMDRAQLASIHQALVAVQHAVTSMTFSSCDKDDVIELIERVESELHATHPNVTVMGTFLNSIARSLRNQPEARHACLVIEDALEGAGFPSTWQSGI